MPRVLVTVGSTRFDQLVQACLSEGVVSVLKKKGFTELIIQYGNSTICQHEGLDIPTTLFKFKPSLLDDFTAADLIISHAGSGTIIEVMRLRKPLIIVPNQQLMDNHQLELAQALHAMNVCKVATIENLPQDIEEFDTWKPAELPVSDPGRFRALVDEELGFSSSPLC